MDPYELNLYITAVSNTLATSLSEEDYAYLCVILNELLDHMQSILAFRAIQKSRGFKHDGHK